MNLIVLYYLVAAIVAFAVSVLMDVTKWIDFLKAFICTEIATSVVILGGHILKWEVDKTLLGVIVASCYARPIVYGINRQIKVFFKDPIKFIRKYKGKDDD